MDISSPTYYAPFIEPEDVVPTRWPAAMRDYEMGPAAWSDASDGFNVKEWEFRQTGGATYLGPRDTGPWTLLFTPSGALNSLSGTFDPDARPVVAYSTTSGIAYVRYWSATSSAYVSKALPDAISPRVVMPDKRGIVPYETLLFYLKDGKLYERDLADEFTAETYLMDALVNVNRLGRIGMNGGWRLQIEFRNHL